MESEAFPIKMAEATEAMLGHGNIEYIELQKLEPSRIDKGHATGASRVLDFVKQSPVTIDELKSLIKSTDADVNFCDTEDRKTALHWAVLNEETDVVDVLLKAGANIKRDVDGNTALHYAVQSGTLKACDIFKRLLPPRETLDKNCRDWGVYSTLASDIHDYQTKTGCWIMVTSVNKAGFNILDLALQDLTYEKRKIVEYIVRDTDLYCLRRLLQNNTGRNFSSPLRGLIKKMPEIAIEVMDKFITSNENKITFDYEILDDTYFLQYWPPDQDDYPITWEQRQYNDIGSCEEYTHSIKKMKSNHPLKLMVLLPLAF